MKLPLRFNWLVLVLMGILLSASVIYVVIELQRRVEMVSAIWTEVAQSSTAATALTIDRAVKNEAWDQVQTQLRRLNSQALRSHYRVVTPPGIVLADSQRMLPGGRLDLPLVAKALNAGTLVAEVGPEPHRLNVAVPLTSATGEPAAVLTNEVHWQVQYVDLVNRAWIDGFIAISATLGLIIAVFLTLWGGVLMPISRLRHIANAIMSGVETARAPRFWLDELHETGRAFNSMLDRLAEQRVELHRGRDTLEQRVFERTSDLARVNMDLQQEIVERTRTEAALERAKAKAEAANIAKTRFLAAASHDLRQPLQAAIIFHNILNRRIQDLDQVTLMVKLGQSLEAQQMMLDTLLNISRLDAGIVTAAKHDFPILHVMERLTGEFTEQARASGIELRMVPSSADVHSDPQLLEQMLRNLLSNAIKYTEHGRILMGCRRAGDSVRLQVWDTGIGIPEDQIEAVFEEFYQLHNEARDRRKGLGLGLAIVQRLSRLLDHPINIRSRVGKGTAFEVVIPLGQAAVVALAAECIAPVGPVKGTVVVIDDDVQVLDALQQALDLTGFDVVAAGTVQEAIDALQLGGDVPDVIVSDYRLRCDQTGLDAIRTLCTRFNPGAGGILITGDTSPERLKEATDSGFTILHKPFTPDELVAKLRDAMSREQRTGALATAAPDAASAEAAVRRA